jgi:hypothetical protein
MTPFFSSTFPLATNRGTYQGGSLDGTAFTAPRKDNADARQHSLNVAAGDEEATEYGIKEPSLLATMLPEFDIVYSHMLEFFHDLQIVNSPFYVSIMSQNELTAFFSI